VQLGLGDVANRIITVGSFGRAELIAAYFDKDKPIKKISSSRGFNTFTGFFKNVPVSVVSIGMV
jgi:uridine phosphorylase